VHAKERFAAIQERQAEVSQKFSENVLDATDQGRPSSPTDVLLKGVPDDVLQSTRARCTKKMD
jgi:oligopeptidase A